MADQGLPLMALPQQNLFGAAGDDLASVLANREIAKRKQMLEDIKTQIEMQKSQNETNLANSTVATAEQQRQFAPKKEQANLDEIGARVTQMADTHAKSLSDQQTQQALRQAQDEFDAFQQKGDTVGMTNAGAKIVGYGGHLMTKDQADAINAPVYQAQIQEKLRAYAMEKDPDKKMAIGMELANIPGAKGVPTQDSTPFQFVGNGEAVGDTRNGAIRSTGFTPTAAAKAPIDPNQVAGALNMIRSSGTTAGIPQDVLRAAIAEANKNGQTIVPLTAATRGIKEVAGAQMPTFDKLAQAAQQVESMGLMGTVAGRWRNLLAGEGLGDVSGLTPDQRAAVGNFATLAGLFTSGTMLAHFRGRGGPAAYEIMERLLAPGGKDFATYMADIQAARGVLDNYSKLGGIQDNAPAAGPGHAGSPGAAPAAVDPNNPLGLPRIK